MKATPTAVAKDSSRAPELCAGSRLSQTTHRWSLVIALASLLTLLSTATAGASTIHTREAFGSPAPTFASPRGIAIKESSGDVLVMDAGGTPSIKRYHSNGTPANFSALGSNVIDGVGSGDGTPEGGLSFASSTESQLAVDNSGGATDGDIYVTQSSPNVIDIFSEAGNYLGQLTAAGATNFSEACGVAVDPTGAVYVGDYSSGIYKFVPTGNPPVNSDNKANFTTVSNPCTLTAGAGPTAGSLFAATWNGSVSKLDSVTGAVAYTFGSATTTLATNPVSGHVYLASGNTVEEYDASGGSSATTVPPAVEAAGHVEGVAVRGATGNIYVSDGSSSTLTVFGPAVTVPDLSTSTTTGITNNAATLHGNVNPDGVNVTQCKFEYGPTTSYGQIAPCAPAPPYTAVTNVSASLASLTPETTYHFRLVAQNSAGHSATSADSTFATLGPPQISNVQATSVGTTHAELSAEINPNNAPTTFHVEYGPTASYGQSTPESDPIGADGTPHQAMAELSGLEPGKTYHFRYVATNAFGARASADYSFRTYAVEIPGTGCANQIRREEQGVAAIYLPECRAYELVSPSNKGSGGPNYLTFETPAAESEPFQGQRECPGCEMNGFKGIWQAYAASDGNRMTWYSDPIPAATDASIDYLSTRGPNGWTSQDVDPPMSAFNGLLCPLDQGVPGPAWSNDLTKVAVIVPAGPPSVNPAEPEKQFAFENECGHPEPRLSPDEGERGQNLYLHDNVTGSNQLLNITPPGVELPMPQWFVQAPPWPGFLAASDDFSHVVFEEELALTPDAPVGYPAAQKSGQFGEDNGGELYEWTEGKDRLVTILPDGTPVQGRLAASTRNWWRGPFSGFEGENIARYRHAVSADGARIFWEEGTKVLNESSSPNLSTLTEPGYPILGDLYMREDGQRTIKLDDAEAGAVGPSGGGNFQWANAEGSRAFFMDENQLTTDAAAEFGKPDLYEWRAENTAGCGAPDGCLADLTASGPGPGNVLGVSGASESGDYVYFVAKSALSGAPNSSGDTAVAGQPNLYVAHDGAVSFIATLNETTDVGAWSDEGPTAKASGNGLYFAFNSARRLTGYDNSDAGNGKPDIEIYLYDTTTGELKCVSCVPSGAAPAFGATLKYPTENRNGFAHEEYPQHNVSNAGQVFFETSEALTPRDTNGLRDVYMYSAGQLRLLSTGTSTEASHFLDASPDGANVFITTAQRLVGNDTDTVFDYYDVRVGGGFPESPPLPGCEGEACRGRGSSAANESAAGTAAFHGPGNRLQPHRRNCKGLVKLARNISHKAKQLRKRARQDVHPGSASKLQRRAAKLAKKAHGISARAKKCRHANRRAGQ